MKEMSVGKILYYIFYVPVLLATGVYHVFHFIDFCMKLGVDMMEDIMEEIKKF